MLDGVVLPSNAKRKLTRARQKKHSPELPGSLVNFTMQLRDIHHFLNESLFYGKKTAQRIEMQYSC